MKTLNPRLLTPLGVALVALGSLLACNEGAGDLVGPNVGAVPPTAVGHFVEASGSTAAMGYPIKLAVGDDGNTYVSDTKAGRVFAFDGQRRRLFELAGLDKPLGVAVYGDLLYVGNDGRDDVEVYDIARRSFVRTLGGGAGAVEMPNAIALSPDGQKVFVVDSKSDVVVVYSAAGGELGRIGSSGSGGGQLRFPVAVAVDVDRVAVADQGNHRVQIFDHDGTWRSMLGEALSGEEDSLDDYRGRFTRVQGVAFNGDELFVLDSYHGNVQVFDRGGKALGFMGKRGKCADCSELPLDVAIGPNGALIVTDPEKRRTLALDGERRDAP